MRGAKGGPLRLSFTLRGDGALLAAGAIPVRYQIDVFRRGASEIASGELEGRMASLRGRQGAARLRLEGGGEIGITLSHVEADLAAFDVDDAEALLALTPAGTQ